MTNLDPLAFGLKDIFPHPEWQLPLLLVVIALIVGLVIYRRKQM